jgi:hypothetical protein
MTMRHRLRAAVAAVALAATVALAAAGTTPAASAVACPGTFTVLHADRVGTMAIPRGAYAVGVTGVSCAQASRLIARFLDDVDGALPAGWAAASTGIGFVQQGAGAVITLGSPPTPTGGGGRCPGTFAVGHDDRIGSLSFAAGAYTIRARGLSCAAASKQFATFLFRDFAGRLPAGWKLNVAARRFSRAGASFTVRRAGGGAAGGGVHPNLAITCPGTVTLAAGTSLGTLVLPAGAYYVNVFSNYSCRSATKAFARFAAAGTLPGAWTVEPQTGTFLLGREGFQVEPA